MIQNHTLNTYAKWSNSMQECVSLQTGKPSNLSNKQVLQKVIFLWYSIQILRSLLSMRSLKRHIYSWPIVCISKMTNYPQQFKTKIDAMYGIESKEEMRLK